MPGSQGSPYRAPCGGWNSKLIGYYSPTNYLPTDSAVPVYSNITVVKNAFDGSCSPGSLPYPAPVLQGDCYYLPSECGTYSGDTTKPKCGPLGVGDFCVGGVATTTDWNAYSPTGATVNVTECLKRGFKAVVANAIWQGMDPFGFQDPCGTTFETPCNETCLGLTHYLSSPASIHYLNAKVVWTQDGTSFYRVDSESLGEIISTYQCNFTTAWGVNSQSGNQTISENTLYFRYRSNNPSASWTTYDSSSDPAGAYAGYTTYASSTYNYLWQRFPSCQWQFSVGYTGIPTVEDVYLFFNLAPNDNSKCYGIAGTVVFNSYGEVESASYPSIGIGSSIPLGSWVKKELTSTSMSLTFFHSNGADGALRDVDGVVTKYSGVTTNIVITLSGEYTTGDTYDDMVGLLGLWDLSDDREYPWRHDSLVNQNPLVYRDSQQSTPNIGGPYDPSLPTIVGNRTGLPVGAPNPAGYGATNDSRRGHYQRLHKNYIDCDASTPVGFATDRLKSYGAWTPPNLPSNCTEWVDTITAKTIPPGAWIRNSPGSQDIWGQKWAETMVRRPSCNFARPCGADRWAFEESTAQCVVTDDGTTVNVANSVVATNGDLWIFPDALYVLYSHTSSSITRGAKVAAIPSGAIDSFHTGMVGKLRYPNAPAFGGRIEIASAIQTSSGVITITLNGSAPFLRDPNISLFPGVVADVLDFSGVSGLGSSVSVATLINSSSFTVSGTLTGTYVSGGYVKVHGAADYQWFDDQSKGDFVMFEWQQDLRSYQVADFNCAQNNGTSNPCAGCDTTTYPYSCIGSGDSWQSNVNMIQAGHGASRSLSNFIQEDHCLGYSPCAPSVISICPAGQDANFPIKYQRAMPEIALDNVFGSAWNAAPLQHIPDPFWQAPVTACTTPEQDPGDTGCLSTAEQDDGSCLIDVPCTSEGPAIRYYAHAPMVEAMTATKLNAIYASGAPSLPFGNMSFQFATMAMLQSSSSLGGAHVVAIPSPVTGISGIETPWGLYWAENACILSPPRTDFVASYIANGGLR